MTSDRGTDSESVYLYKAVFKKQSIYLPCTLALNGKNVIIEALLDCGAMDNYISKDFAKQHEISQTAVTPLKLLNVDGTPNKDATITHKVHLDVNLEGNQMHIEAYEACTGNAILILGFTWFRKYNPTIDWDNGSLKFPMPRLLRTTEIEGKLPSYLKDFAKVFSKDTASRLPTRKAWDHAIDLKPDFKPQRGKVYPLSPPKIKALDEFIDENLSKGYIRPSKSPMASPFFFVSKKTGDLRPCQDYRELNKGTVPNAYPIPRVEDLLDRIAKAKPTIFTKLDLRSGYNNVRIKEGDEWKAAFITPRGLFEPLVMFFVTEP